MIAFTQSAVDTDSAPSLYNMIERPEGLAQRVRSQILALIRDRTLNPGDRLPPERTLATQLGVSRSVVREALRSLASMNVIQVRHGVGMFVGQLDVASLVEPFGVVVGLDKSAMGKLSEARLILEPGLARLAADRATTKDKAVLEDLVRQAELAVAEPSAFMEIDVAFHLAVGRMAANPFLTRVVESFEHLAQYGRSLTNAHPSMREATVADLTAVAHAIRDHRPNDAESAMRKHMLHVRQTLESDSALMGDNK